MDALRAHITRIVLCPYSLETLGNREIVSHRPSGGTVVHRQHAPALCHQPNRVKSLWCECARTGPNLKEKWFNNSAREQRKKKRNDPVFDHLHDDTYFALFAAIPFAFVLRRAKESNGCEMQQHVSRLVRTDAYARMATEDKRAQNDGLRLRNCRNCRNRGLFASSVRCALPNENPWYYWLSDVPAKWDKTQRTAHGLIMSIKKWMMGRPQMPGIAFIICIYLRHSPPKPFIPKNGTNLHGLENPHFWGQKKCIRQTFFRNFFGQWFCMDVIRPWSNHNVARLRSNRQWSTTRMCPIFSPVFISLFTERTEARTCGSSPSSFWSLVMSRTQFHFGFEKKETTTFFTWQLWLRIPLGT